VTGTLVLGVGNILLADEGAGVHAMRYLEDTHDLPDTEFLDGGTLSFTLAADIADADTLIVFDAAQLDAEPGTVRVFEDDEVDEFLRSGRRSVHEVGFADLMDIARLEGTLPRHYALIGIQPEQLGWGEAPGAAVARAIPAAAEQAAALVEKWKAGNKTAADT
jgi:hydrogenase maturation protease